MRFIFSFLLVAQLFSCATNSVQETEVVVDGSLMDAEYSIFVVADAGRNGSYDQKRIGEVMGVYADALEPEFVLNCGDMFHYYGIQSTQDPLLISNFESIYPHGELHCKWWGVLGNHEYRGNTQAVIDYTNISRRWNVPARYYTRTFEGANDLDSLQVFFIDTAPLLDKYHAEASKYPDVAAQDTTAQMKWLDGELSKSTAKWKLVVGHHPVYSYSKKKPAETEQMQAHVAKMFDKHGVDASFSGHVHTFQHLQPTDSSTDYFVAPSASLDRAPREGEFTTFAGKGSGFLVIGVYEDHLAVSMINVDGEVVYTYNVTK